MIDHLPFAISGMLFQETGTLLAFFHPKPSHPFHMLILPKQSIRTFMEIEPASPLLSDIVAMVQSIVIEFNLPAYRLIVNGGEYQDFPHLHIHLISDEAWVNT